MRPSRAWPSRAATPASPRTAIAASSRCIRTWCSASITSISRTSSNATRLPATSSSIPRSPPRTGRPWSPTTRRWSCEQLGKPFPDRDPQEQLWGAIGAVFGSWMNQRAITYRRLHDIPADWGTAVNVQAMVFGNMGDDCATGVAFTRNPSTGDQRVLRRISRQRPGRGRRRRHPHAAVSDHRRQERRTARRCRRWKR